MYVYAVVRSCSHTNHCQTTLVFTELAVEGLVDERIHGLCDAHYSRENDAPCVGAVESAGSGYGDGAEQDGSGEGDESDVSVGDVFLECLHECGHDQRHEPGCERGRGGNIHRFLLGLMVKVASGMMPKATMVAVSSGTAGRGK